MGKTLGYYDGLVFSGKSSEELEKELKELEEETKKLTDWPPM